MHLVLRHVRLPLLPLDLGPARRVEVSLVTRLVRASAPLSLQPLRELQRGRLLVRSRRPLPAPLPRLALPAHRSTLCNAMSRESLRWSAPVLDPPVYPDLRIEEQGRIAEPAVGRTAPVTGAVVLAVERVGGGPRLVRCPPASGHGAIGRGLRTAPSRVAFALTLGETGLNPRIDTGLAETAFAVTGRGLLTATGRVDSVRDPLLAGEVVVTVCGHAIPLVALRVLSPPSSDCSRSKEGGRRARREKQERVETVAVSQAPAISEVPAAVVPPVGGTTMAALPSAVQDLARFFLNLAGSSSLGAVGGVAGVAAPASRVGLSCALRLPVEKQSHLVLRLRLLLAWLVLLLLPLLCLARPAVSSVRRSPALAGVAVSSPAMGPVEQ